MAISVQNKPIPATASGPCNCFVKSGCRKTKMRWCDDHLEWPVSGQCGSLVSYCALCKPIGVCSIYLAPTSISQVSDEKDPKFKGPVVSSPLLSPDQGGGGGFQNVKMYDGTGALSTCLGGARCKWLHCGLAPLQVPTLLVMVVA